MTSYRPRAGKRPSARQDAPGPAIPSEADRDIAQANETLLELAGLLEFQRVLQQAGAIISSDIIGSWTGPQRDEAWQWARAQSEANAKAKPSHSISVRWPDHVSAAHLDGMKQRIPPPRHGAKARAARVKQAADRKTRRRRG